MADLQKADLINHPGITEQLYSALKKMVVEERATQGDAGPCQLLPAGLVGRHTVSVDGFSSKSAQVVAVHGHLRRGEQEHLQAMIAPGLGPHAVHASHRCPGTRCVCDDHIVLELAKINASRVFCTRKGVSRSNCPHVPPCIFLDEYPSPSVWD